MLNNISEPITSHAINRGQHTAILNPITNEKLNYSELEHEIIKTSLALRELGIEKNMLVAISLKDSIIHVVIQLSLARIGCIHLPMDWRWGDEEKLNLITHFKPETIIVEDANSAKIIVSHLSLMNKEKVINVDKLIEGSIEILDHELKFDVILANISSNIIMKYSNEMKRKLNQNGILIASGILSKNIQETLEKLQNAGFKLISQTVEEEWDCVVLK